MKFSKTFACILVLSGSFANAVAEPQDNTVLIDDLGEATQGILQASPQQVLEARKIIGDFQAAKRTPIVDMYEDIASELLPLDEVFEIGAKPNSRVPQIFIAKNLATTISFVDAYGNPWPIRATADFVKDSVDVRRAIGGASEEGQAEKPDIKDPQAGSIDVSALVTGATGNMTVYLVGRASPVKIVMIAKSGVFHQMATIKVNEVGPQTDLKSVGRGDEVKIGTKADPDLNSALYGVGPVNSKEMDVEGGEARAWLKDKTIYLQTPLAIFSPDVQGATHALGRYRAYKIPYTTVAWATNEEGKTVSLRIKPSRTAEIFDEALQGSGH
ncbi:DotH/IcmK family type IV secretion protein [Pseudomonas sp. EMN2]|uniref:DotH/IcmK family type IV secretion protein n=1 Tax=Pseudomonas sp. EMN2 TaxID=2615212 RepID=UPI0015B6772E|nr:DotH/IcmK family type IV secretion protein [Pseudomonas sp. EMN2]